MTAAKKPEHKRGAFSKYRRRKRVNLCGADACIQALVGTGTRGEYVVER